MQVDKALATWLGSVQDQLESHPHNSRDERKMATVCPLTSTRTHDTRDYTYTQSKRGQMRPSRTDGLFVIFKASLDNFFFSETGLL